jgi:RimJ/RimL family protein N-acetyltransferase
LTGRRLLQEVKASAKIPLLPRGLAVGSPVEFFLRPVATRPAALSRRDIISLAEWRNRFPRSFLTEFEANEKRTAGWLTDVVGSDDTRILFMVDDAQSGVSVGYMGLAFINWMERTGEADAIVRGGETRPGVMKRALLTLWDWAHDSLGLRTLGVRVRSDNPAVEFYRKVGFVEVRRVALRRKDKADMVQWVEDESQPPGDPSLIHMVLKEAGMENSTH